MRDPEARLTISGDRVLRQLKTPLDSGHFLRSDLARQWQDRGLLVDYDILDDMVVSARRIPFVSFPTEWCDSTLYQAGELTLKLQNEAVEAGYDLKDASAWNVIFENGRPLFCDLLSFVPLTQKRWWAAGQFARHFILPLLVSKKRGFPAHKTFNAWRDGIPHDVARHMLGAARLLTRYWPLMVGGSTTTVSTKGEASSLNVELEAIQRFREGLNASLGWMLSGVKPKSDAHRQETTWENYINDRKHYTDTDLSTKYEVISRWMTELAPAKVLDLGCNSGEFSRLAAGVGANVVALDADHGAIMQGFTDPAPRITYVVAQLDDLRGGFGWNGDEFPGLLERLRGHADLTLMLALIHHLVLGASIPLDEVARFAAGCTTHWLVVELIAPEDVQIKLLQEQRNRRDDFPGVEAQLAAFTAAGFKLTERHILPGGTRELLLLGRTT